MNPNTPKVEINTTLNSDKSLKQIHDTVSAIQRSVDLTGGAFSAYERRVQKLIKDLETITRPGSNPGQTVRDIALAGGGSVAGRVRQSNARNVKSEMAQVQEVLVADVVNFQAGIYRNVAKSVKSALVASLAKSKQDLASVDAEIRAAQIEAQQARVGFATQLSGTRGNVRGTITQNANALGVQGLGTLRSEQAALDKLLQTDIAIKEQLKLQNRELRDQQQLEGQIERMANGRLTPLRQQIEMLQKKNAIERENYKIAQAEARGDAGAVLKSRLKQESLRLDQMALRGVKEESAEFRNQMALIKSLNAEQQHLNETRKAGTAELRNQARLQESRDFAGGKGGTRQEIMQNNVVGARRVAMSDESRASLLGMQGNLLMNYGLLGGGVAAIGGMTAAVIDLDAKLRELQAIAGATNGEFEGLRSVIIKTSEDTKFSATELAEASVMLAQVGQSVSEIEDSLPVISSFAMAVGTDMKNAVDIVTTSLTVFNMNTEQTQRITNVLTEALNRSKLSMDQLVLGFQYAANIAADSGVTFEELTATLAGMSQAGIRSGSMLGTGLRQILISLASPTEEIKNMLQQLGLTMNDVDVRTHGLVGVLKNLADAGLSAGDAMGAFETRTAAALVAATNQVGFIQNVQEQFAYTRAAEEAAAKQSESFKNSFLELKNEFLSFINDAARPVLETMIDLAKGIKSLGNSLGPAIPLIKALGTALIVTFGVATIGSVAKLSIEFIKFSGVFSAIPTMISTAAVANQAFVLSLNTGAAAGVRAAAAMTAFQASLPVIGLILALASGLVFLFSTMSKGSNGAQQLTESLDRQKTAYNEAKAAQDKYQQVLSQLDQTIARLKARSDNLKDGSEELRIEIVNGAAAFNEYGANIDATNIKLEAYIERLSQAKAGVIALAQEQAKEAAQKAAAEVRTAQTEFNAAFSSMGVTGQVQQAKQSVEAARASGKLSDQEIRNLNNAWTVIEALSKKNGNDLSSGEISNLMTNLQVLLNMFGKAEVRNPDLVRSIGNIRSRGATLMGARSVNDQAQVSAQGLALLSNPDWQNFRNNWTDRLSGLGSLNSDMSQAARANRQNPAEAFRQSERIIAQYGAKYRETLADLEKVRSDWNYDTLSPEQRYAFDAVMNPLNDELVRIREILINTQRQNDELAAQNLQALRPLVEQSTTSDFSQLMERARSLGLAPGAVVQDRSSLLDWIDTEISRRTNGVNIDTVLGRDAGLSVIRQQLREEQIRTGGAVAERDRSPMAQRIRDRATEYGLSPDLMRTIASIETGGRFNADATNPRSTARGLFQIMADTWNAERPGQQVSRRIADRNPNDPRLNAEQNMIFAMEEMTRRLSQMTENLGRRPEDWEMYLAWQQGVAGATNILKNPNGNAVSTVGADQVRLNGGNANMTNQQFADVWRRSYATHRGQANNESMRSLGEAAEEAANEAKRNLEQVAEGAKVIATTARNLVTRTMRNLGPETSDENATAATEAITVALQEVEDQTSRYYRLRIQALTDFRDNMDRAGRLTPDRLSELNNQINDLMNARDNDLDRVQEDAINSLSELYTRLPQSIGSIGKLAKNIEDALAALAEQFDNSAQTLNVLYQEARQRIASDIDARAVAFGNMSSAEANARQVLRNRQVLNAQEEQQPAVLNTAMISRAAVTGALDSRLGDTGMTMRGITNDRLLEERAKLATMSRDDTENYAKQLALVNAMNENLSVAVDLRTRERDLGIEIVALEEAMNINTADFRERLSQIIEGWAEERGTFKSILTDVLDGVPGVLDATQGAFQTFFSDILTGTASVGDAFRAMATTILKSMMDIISSAIAKQLMSLLLDIGMSMFGGGSSTPMREGGFIRMREGGQIRAAVGYGPVRGRDSVNIKAMPGEYVLRKSAVDAIGVDNLDKLNADGNRLTSGQGAAKPVTLTPSQNQERPLSIFVVSPDKTPPPSRDEIIVMVQEDMINRGAIYKTTKAVQNGAI